MSRWRSRTRVASQGTRRIFVRLLTDAAASIRRGAARRSPGGSGDPARGGLLPACAGPYFMLLATLLSTALTLVPTVVIAAMAATAISEAISVYSMAVAPRSFLRIR